MDVLQVRNVHQLRNEILEYKNTSTNAETGKIHPPEYYQQVIDNLYLERELLIHEIEELHKLSQHMHVQNYEREEKTSLVLSKVDTDLHRGIARVARYLQLSIGELFSSIMQIVNQQSMGQTGIPSVSIQNIEQHVITKRLSKISITNQDSFSVTGKDLMAMQSQVFFHNITTLDLGAMDTATFQKYIGGIEHCGLIRVPVTISKLLVYAKCHRCDVFEFYQDNININL